MKTKWILAIVAAAMVASVTTAAAERTVLETILVRVNDRIVTVTDFKLRLRQELSQMNPVPQGTELRDFTESLFDTMVDEMILLERAEDRRIRVDEATVDSAILNLREQNDLLDDAAWEEAVESSGMSVEALRERYRRSILLSRTVQTEIRPTEITEEEVRILYEEEKELYKLPAKIVLEQLFFPVVDGGADEEEMLRVARGLVQRVSEGSDLRAEATLAGIEVQELGAIPLADLRSDLRQVLEDVPDAGFADPMVTAGGVQVIHVVERIPEGYQPFEEVEEDIKRRMSARSYQTQSQDFVEGLREEYLVEIDQKQLDFILDMVEKL
ncbi:MAG: SurA N-terminal domain-containing protein [Thermoanaerobaculales bacterium]|jgi:parvulin-like peptidyl-prolyl isomerase|nr:SurA N-terminal domain-containing protein [Thermoanaerobaculales bacterium]